MGSVASVPTVDGVVPHAELTTHRMSAEHGIAERTNDVGRIIPTVSTWDQHFALLSSSPDGALELRLCTDPASIEAFYNERVGKSAFLSARTLHIVHAKWWRFIDSLGEMTLLATQGTGRTRGAVIFPTWTDGIIGEIMWTEPDWALQHLDHEQRLRVCDQADAYEAAWREGAIEARLETVEDTTCSVVRTVEANGDRRSLQVARSQDELRNAWQEERVGRMLTMQRFNRVVTNTYVLTSHKMTVELADRTVQRETVTLLPLGPNLKFVGELSYSMEVVI